MCANNNEPFDIYKILNKKKGERNDLDEGKGSLEGEKKIIPQQKTDDGITH